MRRILALVAFLSLSGSGIGLYFLQDSLDSPWIHWIFSKFSFWVFLSALILSTLAMIRIFLRARKAIRHQTSAMKTHLSGILEELVQDSQALGEFLRIDLPQMEERIKNAKDKIPREIHSSHTANWTKIRLEAESALKELDTLPLEPDKPEEAKPKDHHIVLEYKDLLNRHTKAKRILERVRSDLSLLKEKLTEKGC